MFIITCMTGIPQQASVFLQSPTFTLSLLGSGYKIHETYRKRRICYTDFLRADNQGGSAHFSCRWIKTTMLNLKHQVYTLWKDRLKLIYCRIKVFVFRLISTKIDFFSLSGAPLGVQTWSQDERQPTDLFRFMSSSFYDILFLPYHGTQEYLLYLLSWCCGFDLFALLGSWCWQSKSWKSRWFFCCRLIWM